MGMSWRFIFATGAAAALFAACSDTNFSVGDSGTAGDASIADAALRADGGPDANAIGPDASSADAAFDAGGILVGDGSVCAGDGVCLPQICETLECLGGRCQAFPQTGSTCQINGTCQSDGTCKH